MIANQVEKRLSLMLCVVLALCLNAVSADSSEGKYNLKILWADNNSKYIDKTVSLYAPGNMPVMDNIVSQKFDLIKGSPVDGCSPVQNGDLLYPDSTEDIIIINVDSGECSLSQRIELVRAVGARGIILLTSSRKTVPRELFRNTAFLIFLAYDQ